jgi:hypothetical protein
MFEAMLFAGQPVLAEALITWTVETFYIAIAIIHFVVVVAGFKLLAIDAENNAFVSGLFVAGAAAASGYFLKDTGLVGVIIVSAAIFGTTLATTAGDAIKSIVLTGICLSVYAAVGFVVVPRTPLTPVQVGGFTKAFMVGLDEDAIAGEEDLYEHTQKKKEDSLSEE